MARRSSYTYVFQSINLHWKLCARRKLHFTRKNWRGTKKRKRNSTIHGKTIRREKSHRTALSSNYARRPAMRARAHRFTYPCPWSTWCYDRCRKCVPAVSNCFLFGYVYTWRTKKHYLRRSSVINPLYVTMRRSTIFWLIVLYGTDFEKIDNFLIDRFVWNWFWGDRQFSD